MMPIFFVPSHKCALCQCVAHRETEKEISVFLCPYCDVLMDNIPVDSKQFETFAKEFQIDCEGEVKSVCYEDCLSKEDLEIQFEDIEENEHEYVTFSDSEEENDDSVDKLRTLYFSMAQCSLSELMSWDNDGCTTSQLDGEPSKKQVKLDENPN